MMRRPQRGKVVALAALLAAVVVAALALRRPIEDAWLLHVLRTGDRAAQERAAARLAEHECWRALPDLLDFAAKVQDDEDPVRQAVFRLARPAALPYLRDALRSPEEALRLLCVRMVDRMASFDCESVRMLAIAIEDDEVAVREEAARALNDLGPLAREARPAVCRGLQAHPRSNDLGFWRSTLATCGQFGVAEARTLFSSSSPGLRVEALRILRSIHPAPSVSVPFLAAALKEENGEVWKEAVEALGDLARENDDALRALVETLRPTSASGAEDVIVEAGERAASVILSGIASRRSGPNLAERSVLSRIWARAGVLRPEILESLEGRGPLEVDEAVLLCADLGPAAEDAVPSLERMLEAKETSRRLWATVALARVMPEQPRAALGGTGLTGLIVRAWKGPDRELRKAAPSALAHAGPRALEAFLLSEEIGTVDKEWFLNHEGKAVVLPGSLVPWAVEALSSQDQGLKDLATCVLDRVRSGDAAAALAVRKLLQGERSDDWDGELVFKVLLRLGESADSVLVEVLSKASEDEWLAFQSAVASAPRPLPPEVLEVCRRALRAQDRFMPLLVTEILGSQKLYAAQVVPTLLEVMREQRPRDAVFAVYALDRLGAAAVPGLVSSLRDEREHVRCLAAFTLGRIGNAAVPALSALEAAERDESDLVRGTAEDAVRAVLDWTREGAMNQDGPR